jgi:hypothetical protein
MQVLNWMQTTNNYYGILYAGIALNVNNQQLLWDPNVGIAYL